MSLRRRPAGAAGGSGGQFAPISRPDARVPFAPEPAQVNALGRWPRSDQTPRLVTIRDADGVLAAVRPGQIDAEAERVYERGQALALAHQLASDQGWGVRVDRDLISSRVSGAWAVDDRGMCWGIHGPSACPDPTEGTSTSTYGSAVIDDALTQHRGMADDQDLSLARTMVPALLREQRGAASRS